MSPPSSPTASGYRWIIAPAIALIFCLAALSAWRHNANRAEDSIVAERLDRRASELIGKLGERLAANRANLFHVSHGRHSLCESGRTFARPWCG